MLSKQEVTQKIAPVFIREILETDTSASTDIILAGKPEDDFPKRQGRLSVNWIFITGYKRVRQFSLPAETVRHIWLPPRLPAISCFLPRLLCLGNSFLQRLSRKQNHTDSLCSKLFFVDGINVICPFICVDY